MTSALGDALYPMVSRPIISYIDVSNKPADSSTVLVMASDGLWSDVRPDDGGYNSNRASYARTRFDSTSNAARFD